MILRQPKIHVGLRMVAAGCIVLWLLASSYCSIEHLFGDDHHAEAGASETVAYHDSDHAQAAEIAEHARSEASESHDSEPPSNDSHPHDDSDDACCSPRSSSDLNQVRACALRAGLVQIPSLAPCRFVNTEELGSTTEKVSVMQKPKAIL